MKLHIVGSGCPQPVPEQYGSAFVLELHDELLMVDCGPAATYKMACMGLAPLRVNHLFLTHHHFDHNGDFPCFALTRWDAATRGEPLHAYGPPPTEQFVARLLGEQGAFYPDWQSRIKHPASHACHTQRGGTLPRPAPAVEAVDVGPGEVAAGEGWSVSAESVHHVEPTLQSLAYRVDTDEGSVVFAGDCGDCPELRRFARGVETLVVACTHFGTTSKDIADVITGTPEVVEIAAEAGVRRVVLTHVSPNFARPGVKERAVAAIAREWDGEIMFPAERTTVEC